MWCSENPQELNPRQSKLFGSGQGALKGHTGGIAGGMNGCIGLEGGGTVGIAAGTGTLGSGAMLTNQGFWKLFGCGLTLAGNVIVQVQPSMLPAKMTWLHEAPGLTKNPSCNREHSS